MHATTSEPDQQHTSRRTKALWLTTTAIVGVAVTTFAAPIFAAHAAFGATAPGAAATVAKTASPTPTAPPPITTLVHGIGDKEGDFFITPTGDTTTYANGPEIVDGNGKVVWFHAVPSADTAADFRQQTYNGKPVLTWWQGTGLGGISDGEDVIANDKGKQIATVKAGDGDTTDGHEFLITPQNTALVLSYKVTTADLTSIGGAANQSVIDGVVQEINIKTGKVLFSWNSADHVPYSASEQPLPASAATPWDWFHVNAVHFNTDGSLLIDARDTWATYDVNRKSGKVNWVLGGKDSTFKEKAAPGQTLDTAGEIFSWQHDPEALGHNIFTFFDNDSTGTPNLPYSRVVTVKLNTKTKTATLVKSDNQPDRLSAPSQGNAQTLRDGNLVVGWGALPYFSEFSPSGALLASFEFPTGVNTYRAYRATWPAATGHHRR